MDENLKRAYQIVEESTGSISLFNLGITTLPSNIPRIVNGTFNCYGNNLTSLKNSPEIVNGNFYCSKNKLTNLKGSPKIVNGNFYCSCNLLKTFNGSPKIINGRVHAYYNKIQHFDKSPPFIKLQFFIDKDELSNIVKRNGLQKEKTLWMSI